MEVNFVCLTPCTNSGPAKEPVNGRWPETASNRLVRTWLGELPMTGVCFQAARLSIGRPSFPSTECHWFAQKASFARRCQVDAPASRLLKNVPV